MLSGGSAAAGRGRWECDNSHIVIASPRGGAAAARGRRSGEAAL